MDGYARSGFRSPLFYGKRETGDATEACLPLASGRAARRGAMATATLPYLLQLCLMSPQKTVNRRETSDEGLAVSH